MGPYYVTLPHMYATVALLTPPYASLTYTLPPEFPADFWQPGLRVAVPLGRGERTALRAASAVKTGNAHGMAANETLASGEPQGPGMEYLGGHGVNPEYIDRELNPDAPEIPAGPAPVEGIIMDFDTKEE